MIGRFLYVDGELQLRPGDYDPHKLLREASNFEDVVAGSFSMNEYDGPAFDQVMILQAQGVHPDEQELRYMIRDEIMRHGRIERVAGQVWDLSQTLPAKPSYLDVERYPVLFYPELDALAIGSSAGQHYYVDRWLRTDKLVPEHGSPYYQEAIYPGGYPEYDIPPHWGIDPNWDESDPKYQQMIGLMKQHQDIDVYKGQNRVAKINRESKVGMSFDRPYGYESVLNVNRDELPPKMYHAAPIEAREQILEEGLDSSGKTWNTGHDDWRSETGWIGDPDEQDSYAEFRPEGVYMFPDLEQAEWYAHGGHRDIWEIDTSSLRSDIIKDPSVAHNWNDEPDWQAYVTEYVPPEALRLVGKDHTAATVEDTEPPENFGFMKEPHDDLYPAAFDGDKMSPEVVKTIKDHMLTVIESEYDNPDEWIYFTVFGSGTSYNWDEDGDFDVQMWVDYGKFQDDDTPVTEDDLVADIRRLVQTANFPSFVELGLKTDECEGRMLIQYYAKPGTGSKDENLASKPYACYDMETNEWLQKPKPLTPQFYGEGFLFVQQKCQDIAEQAESLLAEFDRNVLNWQFWTAMAQKFGDRRYFETASEAKNKATMQKDGIRNLFLNVFKGRMEAYSPEGKGIEDERDMTEKLLEVWGIFQKLKHYTKLTLPWEETEMPGVTSGWNKTIQLPGFKILSADVKEIAEKMWVRLFTQQLQPIIEAMGPKPEDSGRSELVKWEVQARRNSWMINMINELMTRAPETYKLWPWLFRTWKKNPTPFEATDPTFHNQRHVVDILSQTNQLLEKMRDDPRPEVQVPDLMRDFKGGFDQLEQWVYAQGGTAGGEPSPNENKTVFDFGDGWTIKQLSPENLGWEGQQMGHCVGGQDYCNIVTSGDSIIYSLRDEKGLPHATLETRPAVSVFPQEGEDWPAYRNPEKMVQIQGKSNQDPSPKYKERIKQWITSGAQIEGWHSNSWRGGNNWWITTGRELLDWYEENKGKWVAPHERGQQRDDYGLPVPDEDITFMEIETLENILKGLIDNKQGARFYHEHTFTSYMDELERGFIWALQDAFKNTENSNQWLLQLNLAIDRGYELIQNQLMKLEDQNVDWRWDNLNYWWKEDHPDEPLPDDYWEHPDLQFGLNYMDEEMSRPFKYAYEFLNALSAYLPNSPEAIAEGPAPADVKKQIDADPDIGIPGAISKFASWSDIMEKAQRLREEGKVQLVRNGYDAVVGVVEGDHGTYNTQITPSRRQELLAQGSPNYPIAIWNCECDWSEFSWGRTRQWKKFEGRPCSHATALYWESVVNPIDEDEAMTQQTIPETQPAQMPQPVQPTQPDLGQQQDEQWLENAVKDSIQPLPQSTLVPPSSQPEQLTLPGTFSKISAITTRELSGMPREGFPSTVYISPEPYYTYYGELSNTIWPEQEIVNAYDNGELIGSVVYQPGRIVDPAFGSRPEGGATTWIYDLFILPDYRNSNAFFEILKPVLEESRASGNPIDGIIANDELENLYLKLRERGRLSNWKTSAFQNGDYVRANTKLEGHDDRGTFYVVPRNMIGEVIWADDTVAIVIFSIESSYLGPHNVRVETAPENLSLVPRERGTAPRRRR